MTSFEKVFFGIGLVITEVLIQTFFRHLNLGIENRGVGLGIFPGYADWLASIAAAIVVLRYKDKVLSGWGWWLVLVGGLANISSRLLLGNVWDYIPLGSLLLVGLRCNLGDYDLWINSADVMITAGAMMEIVNIIKKRKMGI